MPIMRNLVHYLCSYYNLSDFLWLYVGVGNSTVVEFTGLSLHTNTPYYINMRLVNGLGYSATVSSSPFLVDITPPSPGNLESVSSDDIEVLQCADLLLSGLDCLENSTLRNHR